MRGKRGRLTGLQGSHNALRFRQLLSFSRVLLVQKSSPYSCRRTAEPGSMFSKAREASRLALGDAEKQHTMYVDKPEDYSVVSLLSTPPRRNIGETSNSVTRSAELRGTGNRCDCMYVAAEGTGGAAQEGHATPHEHHETPSLHFYGRLPSNSKSRHL